MYLNNYFREKDCLTNLLELRDEKRVKYTKRAMDKSIEEHDEVIRNLEFIETLKDESFNIIFLKKEGWQNLILPPTCHPSES